MPKQFLEDMVRVKRGKNRVFKIEPKKVQLMADGMADVKIKHSKNKYRYLLWLVAFVSVMFCIFAFSFLFAKAEVKVDLKTADIVLGKNLSASKDSSSNGLFFNLVVLGGVESKKIQGSGEKDVKESAKGTVVIFNTFSSTAQPLSIDTRLEGSNGKIYKTTTKTTVPGIGKDGTPGQVEVGIYASVAGAEYNSDVPLDFSIVGFKGTAKYTKIKVRSKPNTAITGGLVGKIPDISEEEKATSINDLKTALQKKLLAQATSQIPDGFILFKDAIFFNNNDSNISSTYNNDDNSVTLTLKGTLYGLLFNEKKLTQKIVKDNVADYDGSEVYIPGIKDLTFTLADKDNISFDNVQNIDFNLAGSTKIVWKLDTDKFTADLLGKPKKDFNQILSQYPNVSSALVKLSPPWIQSLPGKAKNIKVTTSYLKQAN
jgi:hypothetical protein